MARVVFLLAVTGGIVALAVSAHHPSRLVAVPAPPQPAVLYGIAGRDPVAPRERAACTDAALDSRKDVWVCLAWEVDTQRAPIVTPKRFAGRCAHLQADEQSGRWTCAKPVPPSELPPISSVLDL